MSSAGRAGSPASCCGLAENGEPGGARRIVTFGCAGAEIREQRPPGAVEQHVRGLQVPMHDAARVRVFERGGDVDEQRQDARVRGAAQLAQVTARGEHHRQHRGVGAAHRLEDAQDARVVEPCRQREFALEHLPRGLGVHELRVEDLERDLRVAQFITRAPDFAVPAGTEFFDQHEAAAQLGAGLVLVCHRLFW